MRNTGNALKEGHQGGDKPDDPLVVALRKKANRRHTES